MSIFALTCSGLPPNEVDVAELTGREAMNDHYAIDVLVSLATLAPEAFTKAMQMMNQQGGAAQTPRQVESYTVEEQGVEGDDHLFHVTYRNPDGQLTMHSRWRKVGPDWKVADFGILDVQPNESPAEPG